MTVDKKLLKVNPELHKKLKLKAVAQGENLEDLTDEAISEYLKAEE